MAKGKITKEEQFELERKVKAQAESQKNQLNVILIIIASVVVLFVIGFVVVDSVRNFDYQGADFTVVEEAGIIFYQTKFPLFSATGNHVADYNVFLRTDPRELRNVPFDGDLVLKEDLVISFEDSLECNKSVVAVTNLNQVLASPLLEINVFKNESLGCSEAGAYTYLRVQEGKKTEVRQFGPSCYYVSVNDCEVLPGTERFLLEIIKEINA